MRHFLKWDNNRLYDILAEYKPGDRVLFTGMFFLDEDTGYLATEEIFKKNQLKKPDLTFRFTDILKTDQKWSSVSTAMKELKVM